MTLFPGILPEEVAAIAAMFAGWGYSWLEHNERDRVRLEVILGEQEAADRAGWYDDGGALGAAFTEYANKARRARARKLEREET